MANTATATVTLKALTDQFNTEMKSAGSQLKSFSTGAITNFAKIGAGIAVGTTAIVAGGFAFTKAMAGTVDPIAKFGRDLGLSTAKMQELIHVGGLFGLSQGQVQTGLIKSQKFLGDVSRGMSEQKKTLDQLGLSYDELKGKKPDEQQNILLKALNGVEDQTLKNAIAMQVFGRSGAQFAGLSAQMEAVNDQQKKFQEAGLGVTEENAGNLETFNDSLSNLMVRFSSLSQNLAGKLAPSFTFVMDSASALFSAILGGGASAGGVFAQLQEMLTTISFKSVTEGVADFTKKLGASFDFIVSFGRAFVMIKDAIKVVLKSLSSGIGLIITGFTESVGFIGEHLSKLFGAKKTAKFFEDIKEGAKATKLDLLAGGNGLKEDLKALSASTKKLLDGSDIGKKMGEKFNKEAQETLKRTKEIAEKMKASATPDIKTKGAKGAEESKDKKNTKALETLPDSLTHIFEGSFESLKTDERDSKIIEINEKMLVEQRKLVKINKKKNPVVEL